MITVKMYPPCGIEPAKSQILSDLAQKATILKTKNAQNRSNVEVRLQNDVQNK